MSRLVVLLLIVERTFHFSLPVHFLSTTTTTALLPVEQMSVAPGYLSFFPADNEEKLD